MFPSKTMHYKAPISVASGFLAVLDSNHMEVGSPSDILIPSHYGLCRQ